MSNILLEIKDLYVNAEDKEILKGINLNIKKRRNTCNNGTKRFSENLQQQMLY